MMNERRYEGDETRGYALNAHQRTSRRWSLSWTWLLLAVMVSAAVSVGACAVYLPDRSPALLGETGESTSAPVNIQEYSGNRQITLVPTLTTKHQIIGNTSGTVTADYSGSGLSSGSGAMKVNDRVIVALSTSTPLYRNLTIGDVGDDVQALNHELNRLGYGAAPDSSTYSWYTSQGWKQLMAHVGNRSDGSLSLADVLWIPASSAAVTSWTGEIGSTVSAGSPIGEIPGTIVRLDIKNGQAADQDRTLNAFGQTTTLKAGATSVDDAEFCRKVGDTEQFASLQHSDASAGFEASLALPKAIETLRVPAAAVFGVKNNHGCVISGGRTIAMTIVGSELGASLVRPQDGMDLHTITSVALGRTIAGARCS